jgi:hypothetical protein
VVEKVDNNSVDDSDGGKKLEFNAYFIKKNPNLICFDLNF